MAPTPTAPEKTTEQGPETQPAENKLATVAAQASAVTKAPTRLGVSPTTLEEGWRLAQFMAKSQLVPKNFQGKPEDVLVAIQMGIEIGLAPMQALQSIAVINGRPSVWGDGFLALLMSAPEYHDHDEYYEVDGARREGLVAEDFKKDSTAAVCTFWRRGKGTPVTRRFTIGQAKKADLLGKAGPWVNYPDRMLMMRARSWAGRDCFPDRLRGIRTAEEAMDSPPEEAIEIPVREVRRISETPKPEPAAAVTNGAAKDTEPAKPAESAADVELGPIGVKDVEEIVGAYYVVLANGERVAVTKAVDAIELEKLKATSHKLRLTCVRVGEELALRSFAIAD